jgi:predicted O-linked N-acetylglucosamine transferase (SPINDLY family)
MLGIIEGQRGNFAAGLSRLNEALRVRPKATDALINLGRMQSELGRHADAVTTYKKALALEPRSALAHSNLSIVLRQIGERDQALVHCDAALGILPDYADAWSNRGNVLFDLERFDDALADYDKAVALAPNHASAHVGRGNVHAEAERFDQALGAYDRAIAVNPNLVDAWLRRGAVAAALKRHADALANFDRARTLKPDSAAAWLGGGNALIELRRFGDALAAYDRALALETELAAAWLGRGTALLEFKRYGNAFAAYDKALNLSPDLHYAAGHRLYAKLSICDWTDHEAEVVYLLTRIRERQAASFPFPILSIPSSPADQLQCARRCVADMPRVGPVWRGETYSHDRIRVAYVSSDLREHAIGYLTAGLFERHDKARFETTAISFEAKPASDFASRLEKSFDRYIEVGPQSDQEVAELIRALEIDIAVDLNGFTRNARMGVFARRAAPIQVNYLGFPGTMGADCYDYIVADRTVIPSGDFDFYSEKVVWLPDCFLVNDSTRQIADRTPPRHELGLPESGFVFCCFNQSYKLDPSMFDVWMRLLQTVEGSVLWLKDNDAMASRNLRSEAERRGVAPERLVFAPSVARVEDHLARQRQADLFLDTLHYNAHTTASDALWAGVPVLTCLGSTFSGRVAASLLGAVGLSELVTQTLSDYEALALRIAREAPLLGALKAKLAANRDVFPLFDTARFTRHLEAAYVTMTQRARRGEPPQHFAVEQT